MHKNLVKSPLIVLMLFLAGTAFKQPVVDKEIQQRRTEVLQNVMNRIKKEHYNKANINDTFSVHVWKNFQTMLDPGKSYLLKEDIQFLEKYRYGIDDELQTGAHRYFEASFERWQMRVKEVNTLCKEMLEKPFSFNKEESLQPDRSLLDYPQNSIARQELWRRKLKFYVLERYVELKKTKDSSAGKIKTPDKELEMQARKKVALWIESTLKQFMAPSSAEEKFRLYVNTVTMEVDPHTLYYPPLHAKTARENSGNRYFGIGIELGLKDMNVIVNRLLPGGAAMKSGAMQENDFILQISNEKGGMTDISGMPLPEISQMIRGNEGEPITLTIKKTSGTDTTFTLVRHKITNKETAARSAVIKSGEKKIGYILLPTFYRDFENQNGARSAIDVGRELDKLIAMEADGVIVDLRNNPGGSLEQVVDMASLFMPPGPVVQVKDKDGIKVYNSSEMYKPSYTGPLTVLINESSASASEIFAAVIQDRQRGIVIGNGASFGKGTVQKSGPMGKLGDEEKGIANIDYGTLMLTIQQFYRVNGASTQLKGVVPDIIIPGAKNSLAKTEKDYSNALPWDSIPPATFHDKSFTKQYNALVREAIRRIGEREASAALVKTQNENANTTRSLELNKFLKQQSNLRSEEQSRESSSKLPLSQSLTVVKSINRSVHPSLLTTSGAEEEQYNNWLKSISRDKLLAETVEIMKEMCENQVR